MRVVDKTWYELYEINREIIKNWLPSIYYYNTKRSNRKNYFWLSNKMFLVPNYETRRIISIFWLLLVELLVNTDSENKLFVAIGFKFYILTTISNYSFWVSFESQLCKGTDETYYTNQNKPHGAYYGGALLLMQIL